MRASRVSVIIPHGGLAFVGEMLVALCSYCTSTATHQCAELK